MVTRLQVTVPTVALVYDKKILKQTLRVAGNEVAAASRQLIRRSQGGGKVYYGSAAI
jgi:phosphotransferase system IIB component